jgi:hypothetical protein
MMTQISTLSDGRPLVLTRQGSFFLFPYHLPLVNQRGLLVARIHLQS